MNLVEVTSNPSWRNMTHSTQPNRSNVIHTPGLTVFSGCFSASLFPKSLSPTDLDLGEYCPLSIPFRPSCLCSSLCQKRLCSSFQSKQLFTTHLSFKTFLLKHFPVLSHKLSDTSHNSYSTLQVVLMSPIVLNQLCLLSGDSSS